MRNIVLILITAIGVLSCGQNNKAKPVDKSEKFIGKWQSISGNEQTKHLTISKNGNNFILEGRSDFESKKYSASYNKEQDKLELSTETGAQDITYIEATHRLLIGGLEWQKIGESSSNKKVNNNDGELVLDANESSFENDVRKSARYAFQKQKLEAKAESDENAKKELEDLRKEIEKFEDRMGRKYKDKMDDKMSEKAMKIMMAEMEKCK